MKKKEIINEQEPKKVKRINKILEDIFKRVKDDNHRTPTGYSRMHHRHSRS
jgi:hypothetical protein